MKSKQKGRRAVSLAIASLISVFACSSAMAGESPRTILSKLSAMENRFFFHQYPNDPADKRLERLELLIFGGTQAGGIDERLARLSKSISERDSQSVPAQPNNAQAPKPPASKGESSKQYPILNTFEWRVFKKTYPNDSLDERLARLETKLFGQPSPAISYYDRVDRLKKILSMDAGMELPKGRMGPTSKARPRGQWSEELPSSPLLPRMPGAPGEIMPGFPEFGMQFGPSGGMFGQLDDMMRQMQQQMKDLQKLPPGSYEWDPTTGEFVEKDSGKRFKSPAPPSFAPKQVLPKKPRPVAPPPYNDPNSI